MSTTIRAFAFSALLLCASACSEEQAKETKAGATDALNQAKEGAAAAGAAAAATWDSMASELGKQSEALKTALANATPEAKAKLQALSDTFHQQMALAKQKFEEAKAAAPEKMAALKQEGQAALDAAKKAYADATAKQ